MLLMRRGRANRKGPRPYWPQDRVREVMRALLWYEDGVVNGDVNEKSKRYLDTEKVDLLNNYIFPSMANVIFFFRCMSRYPRLKARFENDVKDLLGVRRENPRPDNYGFIFSALGPIDFAPWIRLY